MTATVHLDADTVHLAPSVAAEARAARRFVYVDGKGRRLLFRLDSPGAKGGGYWYASFYAGGNVGSYGTVNLYAGAHRPGPRAKRPACLSVEGLRRVVADLDRVLGGLPVREVCPCCGRTR